jgi:hypothetical protein
MIAGMSFSTFCGPMAMLLVCTFAVGFLIRFFIALLAEERRPPLHAMRLESINSSRAARLTLVRAKARYKIAISSEVNNWKEPRLVGRS